MQSLKRSLTAGLLLLTGGVVHAAAVTDLPPAPPPPESAIQQHIQKMVEEDYAWEAEKRDVANELELERMKSEIRKLRGEESVRSMVPTVADPSSEAFTTPQASNASPHLLLESNIGGLSRVAVSSADGSELRYVSPGERFMLDGRQYQLIRDKKSGLLIKETGQ